LHDRFAQVFVGDRQAHLFRHVQPHAIVDELLQHKLLQKLILDVVLSLVFVEAIRIFIGPAIFIQGDDLVSDGGDDVAAFLAEAPPAHRNDEREGEQAHDGFEEPWIVVSSFA